MGSMIQRRPLRAFARRALFAQQAVVGKGFLQELRDQPLVGAIRGGHGRIVGLGFRLETPRVIFQRQPPGLLGDAARNFQFFFKRHT